MKKTKKPERTPDYNIKRSQNAITLIEQYFPLINVKNLSDRSFVTRIHRLLPYRLIRTAKPSLDFVKQNDWIPAALLARSCAETTSIIFAFNKKVKELSLSKDKKNFEIFCVKTLFASKVFVHKTDEFRAPNILTYIQKMDEEINDYYTLYKILSEYCHPNILGWLTYSDEVFKDAKSGKGTLMKKNSIETARSSITIMLRISLLNAIKYSIETERILELYYPKDIIKTQSSRIKRNPTIIDAQTIYKDFLLHNLYLLL